METHIRSQMHLGLQTTLISVSVQVAKRTGIKVEVIPETEEGDIDIQALEALCSQGPKPSLIAITHIPTNCGEHPVPWT